MSELLQLLNMAILTPLYAGSDFGLAGSRRRVVDASQDRRPSRPAVQRQDGRGVSDHQRLYPVGGSSKVLQHRAVAV